MGKPYYISMKPFLPWKESAYPCDWEARFGRKAPIELEIGFGNGERLVERAAARPGAGHVGIEIGWSSVKRALRRIARDDLENVAVMMGDARVILERLFAPRSIDRIACLFPCPWPKERHEKHRLFATPFLRLMNGRLAEGGEVRIVTDSGPFREWLFEQIEGSGFAASCREIPALFDTKYERKWSNLGQERFHDIRLTREKEIAPPAMEEREMKVHRLERFDPDRFEPEGITGDTTVRFQEFLYDPKREKGMVRALVAEEGLRQEFWIEIARTGEGWKIRPARGSVPVPTAGAQKALDLVKEGATLRGR